MKSIRRYQLRALLGGMILIVLAIEAFQYLGFRRSAYDNLDLVLASKAAALATLMDRDWAGIELDFADEAMPEYSRAHDPSYFEIWIDDNPFEKSQSLQTAELPRASGPPSAPRTWNIDLPDGRPGRAIGVEHVVQSDRDDPIQPEVIAPRAIIVVAVSREPLERQLQGVFMGMIGVTAVLASGLALLNLWTVGRGLKPAHELAAQTNEIDSGSLHQRIDMIRVPEELRPIAEATNRLVERLQNTIERERRITASIAHELRTPLAELQSVAELSARWRDDEALAIDAVQTAHEIGVEMNRIVDVLLACHRADSSDAVLDLEAVALAPLVSRTAESHDKAIADRALSVSESIESSDVVMSNRDALSVILANLVSNAVAHAPDGGSVRIWSEPGDDSVRLAVANTNATLQPEDLERLSEPFWRKDDARSDRDHFGLGLTLVVGIARAAGISVGFALDHGDFVVRLDMARATPSPG